MKRPGLGTIALIVSLGAMLLGTGYFVYEGFAIGDEPVPATFYVAMAFGSVFSMIVGVGLMALVFYSSRKGYDDPPSFGDDTPAGNASR
jgi:hypothetical protein